LALVSENDFDFLFSIEPIVVLKAGYHFARSLEIRLWQSLLAFLNALLTGTAMEIGDAFYF
jgi:hypothetical protein